MDETNLPAAQGTQTEGNSETQQQQDQQQNQQVEQRKSGAEARIDELVAKFHEQSRISEQLLATIAEQQATIAALQSRTAQTQEREEVLDIDPDEARRLHYIVEKATAPLKQEIQALRGHMVQAASSTQMAEVQAQLQKLNNPAVSRRVEELIAKWRRDGTFGSVATPIDALKIAAGELALGQLGPVMQSRDERGRFNSLGAPTLPGHAGGTPAPRRGTLQPEDVLNQVQDLNELSFEQLDKLLNTIEQKYPDGVPLYKG